MIDGVKILYFKNLYVCRCIVIIGFYFFIEYIILGIFKFFLKILKYYNFCVCL